MKSIRIGEPSRIHKIIVDKPKHIHYHSTEGQQLWFDSWLKNQPITVLSIKDTGATFEVEAVVNQ